MSKKRTVEVEVGDRKIAVTMLKHHWSRQMKLSAHNDGRVTLTLPMRTPWPVAETFLQASKSWLAKHARVMASPRKSPTKVDREEARALVERRLMHWSPQINLSWNKVRIANQRTRWGSCSSSGTLSFNWRLVELPLELVDYVIIHELCHINHMNHSPQFWAHVSEYLPDYKELRKQLKNFDSTISEG